MIDPYALRDIIRSGLLSFPVTPFDADNRFARRIPGASGLAVAASCRWVDRGRRNG